MDKHRTHVLALACLVGMGWGHAAIAGEGPEASASERLDAVEIGVMRRQQLALIGALRSRPSSRDTREEAVANLREEERLRALATEDEEVLRIVRGAKPGDPRR